MYGLPEEHRQRVEGQSSGVEPVAQLPQHREPASYQAGILAWFRYGHQAAQSQVWQGRYGVRQRGSFLRADAALAGFAADVDLDADLERRQAAAARDRQAFGHLESLDAVYPVEMFGYRPGLVALQRPDEMPFQIERGKRRDLANPFLGIVFAESSLAGRHRLVDSLRGHGLAYRQQGNIFPASPGPLRRCGDTTPDSLQVGANCCHNALKNLNKYIIAASPIDATETHMDITELLAFSVKNKASDLHLSAGLPPMIRVHGDVRRINLPPMEHKDVHSMVYDIMNDGQRKHYEENLECDFSFAVPNLARFRVNAFVHQRGAGAVFRTIPSKVLSLEELNCPKIFQEISEYPRGVVLVTGPTGSGKSTTLAAMVNYINENEHGHVLTVEDPIEFVHESKKCLINQREVGPHTLSFNNALRSALREDPDVILVGEMRDLETIRLALTAAETGHLVFGTLHTSSAAKTIDRVIDVFPAAEKEMVRAMLSESLRAVISQTLLKTKDGQGRVAAHEIMIGTPAIRNLIREAKIAQMYSAIQTGQALGMQTLDQNLADLVRRNIVSAAEARTKAANKDNFAG